jgi:hypothetical protein
MAAEDELRPQQPMLEDASPTPAAVESGATSDGGPSGDGGVGDQSSSDSPASEEERPPIAAIVAHRDTKGQPDDPVLVYYTVQYAGLDELGAEGEEELPEDEVLRRAPKILREYRRGVAGAASTAASAAAEAASSARRQAGAARRRQKPVPVAGGARGGGAWTEDEVAQVVELGRALRGQGLGEAGFEELARRLGRTAKAVYGKWHKVATPRKRRASGEGGGEASDKARRVTQTGEGRGRREEVEEQLAGGCESSAVERSLRRALWHSELECAGLRAEVRTLRECLALLGMRGIDRRGGVGADRGWQGLPRSTSRSPPRNPNDPFASQHLASGY